MLRERGQKETQSKPGSRPWRTYSRGASKKWLFKYLQVIIMCFCLYDTVCLPSVPYNFLYPGSWFTLLIAVYFLRLKINHDSHEFILESGTVANTTYIHYNRLKRQRPDNITCSGQVEERIERLPNKLNISPNVLNAMDSNRFNDNPYNYR
jgi:hypothetical protein